MTRLILSSESKAQRMTCKNCVFDIGTKNHPVCEDENFLISTQHGFEGGCDNPKKESGIFIFIEE